MTFEALDRILRQHSSEIPAGEIISVRVDGERDILEIKYIPHTARSDCRVGEGGEVPVRGFNGLATAEDING